MPAADDPELREKTLKRKPVSGLSRRNNDLTEPILPPLKPIPMKDRVSVIFIEKGNLDVLDCAFVVVDKNGVRTHIPVGGVACLMLQPGTRIRLHDIGGQPSHFGGDGWIEACIFLAGK